MNKRKVLEEMYYQMEELSKQESMFLFRLARRAEHHGCSAKLVSDIRNEAFWCNRALPEHLANSFYIDYRMKYAFKM